MQIKWVWSYALKDGGAWPSVKYEGHNTPTQVVTLEELERWLETIAQPDQSNMKLACSTGDALRVLAETLYMLNKGRDEAAALLAELRGQEKEGG